MHAWCFASDLDINPMNNQNKAAELDSSARIWLCTPQQTSTESLTFLAKNQQLADAMLMGKQQTPPPQQPILFRSFGRQ